MTTLRRATAWIAGVASLFTFACSSAERAPGVHGDDFSRGPVIEGPCTDGGSRECGISLGEHDGVLSCFKGVQRCEEGNWSACGAPEGGGTVVAKKAIAAGGDSSGTSPEVKAFGESSSSSNICANNPCDPYCMGFEEIPGGPITATPVTVTWVENPVGFGASPPGFIDKLVKQPCTKSTDCGYDHHCDNDTKKCIQNAPGWTYPASTCAGPNLTVGPSCDLAGVRYFPVCNRGNTAIPAGTVIKMKMANGNWIQQSPCPDPATTGTNCTHTLAGPLEPGTCASVTTCGWGGNVAAYINSDQSVSECNAPSGAPGCQDNWSDVKSGETCRSRNVTMYRTFGTEQTYVANCAPGHAVSWQSFAYDTTNADGTSVKFEVQSAPMLADGSVGTWTPLVTIANTLASDPDTCAAAGPSPCPKSLFDALGGLPNARNRVLKVKFTLYPSQDGLQTPKVNSWQLSYSCKPSE